jgi:hypothetical protein
MRMMLAFAAVLYSATALAQTSAPPAAETDTPAVAAKPAKAPKAAATKGGAVAPRLQACQDIEDGTKGRLDCYDAVIKPAPNPKAPAPKTVMQCKFTKEEDERLNCYNGFVDSMPKLPRPKS